MEPLTYKLCFHKKPPGLRQYVLGLWVSSIQPTPRGFSTLQSPFLKRLQHPRTVTALKPPGLISSPVLNDFPQRCGPQGIRTRSLAIKHWFSKQQKKAFSGAQRAERFSVIIQKFIAGLQVSHFLPLYSLLSIETLFIYLFITDV